MQTLRELCNIPKDKLLLMEMFKNGKKIAERDLSDMTCQKLKVAIQQQEMQGRTWTCKTIKL